jgi:hypothetical protein
MSPCPHLKTESDQASEALFYIFFEIYVEGESPETQNFGVLCATLRTLQNMSRKEK